MAFDRLAEAEKLSSSEREGYERAITETLGTMYTGPSSLRRQRLITDHLCADETSSLQSGPTACVIANGPQDLRHV
jgi:hypothetical protein